jgi:hypothetical protein
MIDFDSHFSNFELPKKLYHLDDDLHPKSGKISSLSDIDIDDALSVSERKSDNFSVSGRGDLYP